MNAFVRIGEIHELQLVSSQAPLNSLMERVGSYQQRIGQLSRQPRILLFMRVLTIAWLGRQYGHVAPNAIRMHVNVAARSLLHEAVFLPLIGMLRERLADLLRMQAQLESVRGSLLRRVGELRDPRLSLYRFAVGVSVVDAQMLDTFYERWVFNREGEAKLVQRICGMALEKSDSLLPLLQLPPGDLAEALLALCQMPFMEEVKGLNTLAVFRERYGDHALSVLDWICSETRPRAQVRGDANQRRPVAKIVGWPAKSDWMWLDDGIRRVDKLPGDFESVELEEESSAIEFVSYRVISVTDQMEQLKERMAPVTLKQLLHGSPYPHMEMVPRGRLTGFDAMIVATHGVACGAVKHSSENGWELDGVGGKPQPLGGTPDEVIRTLQTNGTAVVFIYRRMWQALLKQGPALVRAYEEMLAAEGQKGTPSVETLWNARSVRQALDDVRELMPYFQKLARGEE